MSLEGIEFNRCITLKKTNDVQLHGFCDVSEKAYGACLYLRVTDLDNNHHSLLICSKSRVAPLKTTTLPQSELCGANL